MIPKPKHPRRKPKQRERNRITKAEADKALDWFGEQCNQCGSPAVDIHHVVFRSSGGRGVYRNLMPLCDRCHTRAHREYAFAEALREERREVYGEHFYKDMYDLYELELIAEATEEEYQKFMRKEEMK